MPYNNSESILIAEAPLAIAMFDKQMRYITTSKKWLLDYHIGDRNIIGLSHYEVFPEIGDDWKKIHQDCLQGVSNHCDEAMFVRGDGQIQWIRWDVRPWTEADGTIGGIIMFTEDLTDKKLLEKTYEQVNERLVLATTAAGIGIWEYDLTHQTYLWNDNMFQIYGKWNPEEGSLSHFWENRLHPDDLARVNAEVEEAIRGEKNYNTTFRIIHQEKGLRYIHGQAVVEKDQAGRAKRIVGINWDMTERMEAAEKLRISEETFRLTFEHSAFGMSIVDAKTGAFIDVNNTLAAIFGYSKEELLQTNLQSISHPEDAHRDFEGAEANQLLLGEITVLHGNKRYIHKQGHTVWTESVGTLVRDKEGNPLYFIGQIKDITKEKRLNDELIQREKDFRGAFENSAVGMVLASLRGRWLKVNRSLCKMVGYEEAELLELDYASITHPEDLASNQATFNSFIQSGEDNYQIEKRYIHKNGSIVWVILTVSLVRDAAGNPLHLVTQMTDITAEKAAQQELEATLSKLQNLLDASKHVAIIGTDLQGTINIFNKGAENLLGYTAEEMVGKKNPSIIHDPAEMAARGAELSGIFNKPISGFGVFVAYAQEGAFDSREWTYVKKDGSRFPVQLVVGPITNNDEIVGFLGIALDISQIKAAERALETTNKELKMANAELEEFAFIASHDLQEPLRGITGFIGLIEKKHLHQLDEKAQEYFQFITEGANRMKNLINDLLEYSRTGRSSSVQGLVSLNGLVGEIAKGFAANPSEPKPIIKWNDLPDLYADHTAMLQLFMNLIGNGIKYQPKGNQPIIEIIAEEKNEVWQFSVSDNGIGILPKFHEKVFVLFQRLHGKTEYSGTGIGLAICKKIVQRMHGDIWLESTPGEGSTFYFTIPKVAPNLHLS